MMISQMRQRIRQMTNSIGSASLYLGQKGVSYSVMLQILVILRSY
jgi:hypothetical protein